MKKKFVNLCFIISIFCINTSVFSMNSKQRKKEKYNTKLFLKAARLNQFQKLKKLINKKKVDINATDKDGIGSLMLAASNNNLRCLLYLISKGAVIDLKNKLNVTALMSAVYSIRPNYKQHNIKIIKKLLKNGANPDIKDIYGWSAFHIACLWGHEKAVIEILKYNPNIESINNSNQAPIDSAIIHKHQTVIEILLELGAEAEKLNQLKDESLKNNIIKKFKEKLFKKIFESERSLPQDLINLIINYLT